MNAAILTILVLAAPPSVLRTEEQPSTRLFIRTVPDGAKIVVDGNPLGESDGLFVVPPGVRSVTIELDGYGRAEQDIPVPEGRITRFQFRLEKTNAKDMPADPPSGKTKKPPPRAGQPDSASPTAASYVARSEISQDIRDAMHTVLRQHPGDTRWSGRKGTMLFAIASKALPEGEAGQRAVPALLDLVHMLAVHEVLKAKSLLDRYAAAGLDDATTLSQAVEKVAGKLEVTGKVKGLTHQASVEGDFAIGYVIADESALTAHLMQPAELDVVQQAYREVMHQQARDLMERSDWQNALLLWQHLHKRELVSQQLYLDTAQCFKELDQDEDAIRVLAQSLESLGEEATCSFLERAGDIALSIETDAAQELAARAYDMASEKLSVTVSTGSTEASTENGVE